VREERQNLTDLLDDVKKGREVVITDRGRPVARLAPVERRRPFPNLARVRRGFCGADPALTEAVFEERSEALFVAPSERRPNPLK
jgi:prevent-host-death family protein